MSEEEAVIELELIANMRIEHGFAYGQKNALRLQEDIKTLLQSREKDKAELERLRYIKKSFDYVVQKEIERKDKIIDEITEYIAFNYDINSFEDIQTIKTQLKNKFEKESRGIKDE